MGKRALYRRQKREADKRIILTREQIQQIKLGAVQDAIDLAFPLMCGMAGKVLRERWGFGSIRMRRFMEQLMENYRGFSKGDIKLEDWLVNINDLTGMDMITLTGKIDEEAAAHYMDSLDEYSGEAQ